MQRVSQILFAAVLVGLGAVTLIYHDFAMEWQPVPAWVPARAAVADGSGIILLVCGVGLLIPASAAWASCLTLVYCFVWMMLKVPALVAVPLVEANWAGLGELLVIFAGALALFLRLAPTPLVRVGRDDVLAGRLLGAAVITTGLGHFVYAKETAGFVPHWIPHPLFVAYATGAIQLVCAVALLFSTVRGRAAILQSAMFTAFTVLVWIPAVVAAPSGRFPWTALLISSIITMAGWLVAADIVAQPQSARTTT